MTGKRALILLGLTLLAGAPARALTGLPVTNNADLVNTPHLFWSRTFTFRDEFSELVPTNTLRIGRASYVQVRGRDVAFYVPPRMARTAASLSPGDRIQVHAEIQSVPERGLVITVLALQVDTWTIHASARGNGSIEPSGSVKVAAGRDAVFTIRAAPRCHIASVSVDGASAGDFGPGSNEFTCVFSGVTNHHNIFAAFEKDRWKLSVGSEHEGAKPPPGTYTFDAGTEVQASLERPECKASTPGTRYVCRGWMGAGSVPPIGTGTLVRFTITKDSHLLWNWGTEYWLQMTTPAGGTISPGVGWFLTGEDVELNAVPKAGWRFDRWSGDVPPGEEGKNPVTLTMDGPRTIDAKFERDVQTITATAGENGKIRPSGDVEVATGEGAQFAITAVPGHHIAAVLVDGQPVRAFAQGDTTFTYSFALVNDRHTIDAAFERDRHALKVESERGTPEPAAGTHAFDSGAQVEARLDRAWAESTREGTRFACRGWKGTGSAPASGTGTTVRFTILRDSSMTWLWGTEYLLKVDGGEGGAVERGETWLPEGATATLKATPDDGYRFAQWSGDVPEGDEQSNPVTLVMDRPRSVSAVFAHGVQVITASVGESGKIQPSGDVDVKSGERAVFTITAEPECHIASVRVDGRAVRRFGEGDRTFKYSFDTVTEGHTIEAAFARDRYKLTVSSERGTPAPAAGKHELESGASVEAGIGPASVAAGRDGARYVYRGWKGTGSIPPEGTGTAVRFEMQEDSSLTWLWGTEYLLKAGGGAGGAIQDAETWCPEGKTATLKATPEDGYSFVRWSGDVPAGDEENNPLTLVMKHPRTVMAIFTRRAPPPGATPPAPPPETAAAPAPPEVPAPAPARPAPEEQAKTEEVAGVPSETEGEEEDNLIDLSGPSLAVSTKQMFMEACRNDIVSNVFFEVWNSGGGTLKYVIVRNVPWLSLSPKLGWSTGEHDRIRMEYRTRGLPPGSYSGSLTVAARGDDALPQEIEVCLTVKEAPGAGAPATNAATSSTHGAP